MTLWGSDTIRDTAEAVGVLNLSKDSTTLLARDVEYRIALVVEEALKWMRKSKRTVLWTQDISNALRALDIEPLYGYESTRILKYGEASLGPGQPLFYVEDEETDLEKLINAPLPKVPREMSFTGHWLAVDGVQPTTSQNPSPNEIRGVDLVPKTGVNPALAVMAGQDSSTTKPLVKHHLSQESQLYFERVMSSCLQEDTPELRQAALASLRDDGGLSNLLPYFTQYISEKVTHAAATPNTALMTLRTMLHVTDALSRNASLNLAPYIPSLIPSILTCLVGRRLGPPNNTEHFGVRRLAASLLSHICKRYGPSSANLKPRLARSCLRALLEPKKPYGVYYGALYGLKAVGGAEVVRKLVVPNLKDFSELIEDGAGVEAGSNRAEEREEVIKAVVDALGSLLEEEVDTMMNGHSEDGLRTKLTDKIGEMLAERILAGGEAGEKLAKAVVDDSYDDL
jgi:transcription initiation factor TFIID subunit 6